MKYEIIKGSEKDFEGAPDWATQCVWNDKAGESFSYWLNPKESKMISLWMGVDHEPWGGVYGYRNYIKAERRPIAEPVWSGAGLPPVGVECEVKTSCRAPYGWVKCKIVFSDEKSGVAFVYEEKHSLDCVGASRPDFFRPIRSPEDVARDEVVTAIRDKLILRKEVAEDFYELIAEGKIPGVKLEGK